MDKQTAPLDWPVCKKVIVLKKWESYRTLDYESEIDENSKEY